MKLIFISSLVPIARPKSGFDIANRTIVDGLKALDIDVKSLGFLTPGETPAYPDDTIILDELEVTNTKVGKLQKLTWLLRAIANGVPVSVGKMLQASPDDIKNILTDLMPYDGLVLNSVQLSGAFSDVFSQDKTYFVAHNVESKSAAKNASDASNVLSSFLFKREAKLLKKVEETLCGMSEHVWTLAESDRNDLGVADKSSYLPLVTSMDLPIVPKEVEKQYDLGMIGSWSWAANRLGLDWFFDQVLPRLPNDFSIAIAGNIGDIPADLPHNVKFLGRVEDATEFAASCRVIPLISRDGTGVQLKTIETFELGLPCVATKSSVRGIQSIPKNCMIEDEGLGFANALITLVEQSRDGHSLIADGRSFHQQQVDDLVLALKLALKLEIKNGTNRS
jgi:hypothetical protein